MLGAGAAALAGTGTAEAAAKPGFFREEAREIPLDEWADVIVAGGGPAGVAAAVSAARGGKKVRLPDGWAGVKGGTFLSHDGKPYALVDVIPDRGEVVLSRK